jgi:hypothetical protein
MYDLGGVWHGGKDGHSVFTSDRYDVSKNWATYGYFNPEP